MFGVSTIIVRKEREGELWEGKNELWEYGSMNYGNIEV